jgi:elongation factor P
MIKASDLKRGTIVMVNDTPCTVDNVFIQTPSARGGASLYKVRFKTLTNKQKIDKTFKGDDSMPSVDFDKREVQYLYSSQDTYSFLDLESYEQYDLPESMIESAIPYLIDDMEGITLLIADGKILGIELPPVVEMEISDCGPSIKGASATSRTKPASFVTGLTIQVPEYLSSGEVVKIDTDTNEFLGRA